MSDAHGDIDAKGQVTVMRPAGVSRMVSTEWKSEGGQTLPLLGLVMMMAAIAATMVIDFGLLYASRAKAHAAADLAALAAAQDLPNISKARITALEWARRNGFDDAASDVTVTVDPEAVPCPHADSCVSVTIERDFKWTFGRLLGLGAAGATSGAVAGKVKQARDILVVVDRSPSLTIAWSSTHGPPWSPSSYGPRLFDFAASPSLTPGTTADRLGLVTFPNDSAGLDCGTSCLRLALTENFGQAGADLFDDRLGDLLSSDSRSNPEAAIEAALHEFSTRGRAEAEHIIILMTDGDFNSGSHVDVAALVAAGVRVDVIGIGHVKAGLDDIASQTGGTYYPAPLNANQVEAELEVIAGTWAIAITQ